MSYYDGRRTKIAYDSDSDSSDKPKQRPKRKPKRSRTSIVRGKLERARLKVLKRAGFPKTLPRKLADLEKVLSVVEDRL